MTTKATKTDQKRQRPDQKRPWVPNDKAALHQTSDIRLVGSDLWGHIIIKTI